MLLAIRERVMGILGWVILGILTVAFAFFGLNTYLQSSAENYAASVNGVEIPTGAQQRTYQQLRERLRDVLGSNYDPDLIDEDELMETALRQLIQEELLLQATESEGFAPNKQLVAEKIAAVDAFREGDAFSKARYERALRMQGMTPAEFEYRLQREMMASEYRAGIANTASVTPREYETAFSIEGEQRRFSYLVLPVAEIEKDITIEEGEAEQYFNDNPDKFMSDEQVRVEFVELNASGIDMEAAFDEEDVKALYDAQPERFITPEQRHARHILVQVPPAADEAAVAEAEAKARALIARLDAGEEFAVVAEAESDDPGSSGAGGDLGFFERGLMVPEFDDAVFALEPGQRSDLVRTSFGFHIIELVEVKAGEATPLTEVRAELEAQLLAEARNDEFFELSEILANAAYENPDSLASSAEAVAVEVRESGWITRQGGEGIFSNGKVVAAAFSDDVLQGGYNSSSVEIADGHVVVVRLLEHKLPALREFSEVADQVNEMIMQEKRARIGETRGSELVAQLESGSLTLQLMAERQGLEVTSSELVMRNSPMPDPVVVRAAFSMPAPGSGNAGYASFPQASGDLVIVALEEVKQGELSALDDTTRKQTRNNLSKVVGTIELSAAISGLEEKATIRILAKEQEGESE